MSELADPRVNVVLRRAGLDWIVTSQDAGIELRFSRLRKDRDGLVRAQVAAVSTLNGRGELTPSTYVGLESSRSRADFVRDLVTTTGEPGTEWAAIFAAACDRVVKAELIGEPPVLIREPVRAENQIAPLPPLILSSRPVILFGAPGTGKSQLLLDLADCLHTGESRLELKPAKRILMLYVDCEDERSTHNFRLSRRYGPGVGLPDIYHIRIAGSLRQNLERLQRHKADLGVGGMVFDSGGAMCGGLPEEAGAALDFFNAMRQLDLEVAIVACHVNRNGDTAQPFGSQYWNAAAGSTWFVSKEQEVGENTLTIMLRNRKPAQNGKLQRPLAFRYTFESDQTLIKRLDPGDVDGLQTALSYAERIDNVLRPGRKTYSELFIALPDIPPDVLRATVNRWEKKGRYLVSDELAGGKPVKKIALVAPPRQSDPAVPAVSLLDDDSEVTEAR